MNNIDYADRVKVPTHWKLSGKHQVDVKKNIVKHYDELHKFYEDKQIHLLMEKKQYQDYLGIEKFNDYIDIPQRFACDNLNKTIRHVEKQLKNSTSEIFLVGVGHVKSGLLHELKNIKNAVYIDVGVGIDALAGIVNLSRPYFGDWKNFQFRQSNLYNNIDLLVNKNNNIKNINYLD